MLVPPLPRSTWTFTAPAAQPEQSRRAAALREGAGPGYRRGRAGPQSPFSFFDPFKNYSLQIPGLLGAQEGRGRRREVAAAGAEQGAPASRVAGRPGRKRLAVLASVASPGSVSLGHQGTSERRLRLRLRPAPIPKPPPRPGPALRPPGPSGSGAFPGDGWPLSMPQYGHPSPLGMARGAVQQSHPAGGTAKAPGPPPWIGAGRAAVHTGFPRARAASG